MQDVEQGLKRNIVLHQLAIIRLRNTSKAFLGSVIIKETSESELNILWTNVKDTAHLIADLKTLTFTITHTLNDVTKTMVF